MLKFAIIVFERLAGASAPDAFGLSGRGSVSTYIDPFIFSKQPSIVPLAPRTKMILLHITGGMGFQPGRTSDRMLLGF